MYRVALKSLIQYEHLFYLFQWLSDHNYMENNVFGISNCGRPLKFATPLQRTYFTVRSVFRR